MKNPFGQYPKVFYQLMWLFMACIICLILGLVEIALNLDALVYIIQQLNFSNYTILIISFLYILFGYIIDRTQDIKKSIQRGALLILMGFLLASFLGFVAPIGSTIPGWGFFIGMLLVFIGTGVISLACIIHIGILFPIANDWKDHAFSILNYSLVLFGLVGGISIVLILDALSLLELLQHPLFLLALKISSIGYLYFLINKYKNIGYQIQDDELDINEEEADESEKFKLQNTMIGLVVIYTLFSFFMAQIPKIGTVSLFTNSKIDQFFGVTFYGTNFISLFVIFIFFIIGYALVFNSKFYSRQFPKIYTISLILILMGTLEIAVPSLGSLAIDKMLELSHMFLSLLIVTPIFLSIATHIYLGKNTGVWIGLLLAIPTIFNEILVLVLGPDSADYLPYLALILLSIFIITFRENRQAWEERLALNEPNQIEDEDDGIDILEHFVEE